MIFVYVYDKDNKLNICFANLPSANPDVVVWKDERGTHAKIGNQIVGGMDSLKISKLEDFAYFCDYSNFDYKYEDFESYLKTRQFPNGSHCSSVFSNGFYGRNYDWYYDWGAEFVIQVSPSLKRHGSIGVVAWNSKMTESFVQSGVWDDAYNILPFYTLDGTNDAHVTCNINVVTAERGITKGTNPGKERLCALAIVRYILDNADSADHAIELLKERDIYAPTKLTEYEFHFMVSDGIHSYVVEFENNQMTVLSDSTPNSIDDNVKPLPNDACIMTNFFLSGWDTSVGGSLANQLKVPTTNGTLQDYACGLERYKILYDGITNQTIDSTDKMWNLMQSVKYTKAYDRSMNPFWYSELSANYKTYGNLTVRSDPSDYAEIVSYCIDGTEDSPSFANRTRDIPKFWQTVHTTVYDVGKGKMIFSCQEGTKKYEFTVPTAQK